MFMNMIMVEVEGGGTSDITIGIAMYSRQVVALLSL